MPEQRRYYPGKTTLVIDDDAFVLKVAEKVLENLGFGSVSTALSSVEALRILKDASRPVGLILTDLNMPDVDGLELLRKLAEQGYQGDLILFSGEDEQILKMAERLARARQLSVLGAVSKPINVEKFQKLLAGHASGGAVLRGGGAERTISPEMLEQAIRSQKIVPWFQPKVDVATRQAVGVEVLARWPESDIGAVFPDEFIPLAEESGLIGALTESLLQQVIPISQQWRAKGINLKLAINLSMDSLADFDFAERILALFESSGVDPGGFQFEITESRLPKDMTRPLEILLRLRMHRIRLSIDDFGTGHSNLNQLRELPFDELKLDKSYVVASASDERAAAILESSIELAKKLDMTIVAEGVETLADWLRLERMGCSQIQGYFAAKPMPAESVPTWLSEWSGKSRRLFQS